MSYRRSIGRIGDFGRYVTARRSLGQRRNRPAAEAAWAGTAEDLAKQDVLADDTLDRLIREGTVTPQMATSLMNDSDAAVQISKRLIAIGEHLAAAQVQAPPAKDG